MTKLREKLLKISNLGGRQGVIADECLKLHDNMSEYVLKMEVDLNNASRKAAMVNENFVRLCNKVDRAQDVPMLVSVEQNLIEFVLSRVDGKLNEHQANGVVSNNVLLHVDHRSFFGVLCMYRQFTVDGSMDELAEIRSNYPELASCFNTIDYKPSVSDGTLSRFAYNVAFSFGNIEKYFAS
jgi:hypothetical protein